MNVAPTLRNRIQSLDVLRGLAVLGILLANIFAFGWMATEQMSGGGSSIPGLNYWVEGMRVALVAGKFRGLFCILFGAGLFLQYGKLKSAGRWPGVYLKRTLILAGIGAIHITLIWFGDILFAYSLTALIVMWVAGLDDRIILGLGIGMLCLISMCGLGIVAAMGLAGSGFGGGIDLGGLLSPSNELRVFQTGSYLEQMKFRLVMSGLSLSQFPMMVLELGGLFLIGLWMSRKGIFAKPSAHLHITRTLLVVGGIGAILNLAIGVGIALTHKEHLSYLIEFGLNAPMAVGYATLGAVLVEKYPNGSINRLLAPVGKMALTGYLLTSVLCTTFFYSWGFGMFGRLNYWGLMGVVFGVWVLVIGFAHFWLRRYSMGPVEWVWRSLTLGKQKLAGAGESTGLDSGLPPVIS